MTDYFIDIGNTRIKHTAKALPFDVQWTAHTQLNPLFDGIIASQAKCLWLCGGRSQAVKQAQAAITAFAEAQSLSIEVITTRPELLAVNYSNPEQFGSDRFLHLLAGRARCHETFCVVSCGTAITLDFYTDRHIGGMILPGLGSARSLLADKASLPAIAHPDGLLGHDTATSIGAGIYIGYQNLIYHSIERIRKIHYAPAATSFTAIFTGGDAEMLHNAKAHGEIVNHLLFEGVLCYQKGMAGLSS